MGHFSEMLAAQRILLSSTALSGQATPAAVSDGASSAVLSQSSREGYSGCVYKDAGDKQKTGR